MNLILGITHLIVSVSADSTFRKEIGLLKAKNLFFLKCPQRNVGTEKKKLFINSSIRSTLNFFSNVNICKVMCFIF